MYLLYLNFVCYVIFVILLFFSSTPNEDIMPGLSSLPFWRNNFPSWPGMNIARKLPNLCAEGVNLVESMLRYDHVKRITAANALKHPYLVPVVHKSFSSTNSSTDISADVLGTPPASNVLFSNQNISVDHATRVASIPLATSSKASSVHFISNVINEAHGNDIETAKSCADEEIQHESSIENAESDTAIEERLPKPPLLDKVESYGVLHTDASCAIATEKDKTLICKDKVTAPFSPSLSEVTSVSSDCDSNLQSTKLARRGRPKRKVVDAVNAEYSSNAVGTSRPKRIRK